MSEGVCVCFDSFCSWQCSPHLQCVLHFLRDCVYQEEFQKNNSLDLKEMTLVNSMHGRGDELIKSLYRSCCLTWKSL